MTGFLKKIMVLMVVLPLLSGCIREEEVTNSPQGNFEALWKIIDEQYCFLEYKQIDWDAIHAKYSKFITNTMSSEGLFEVLGNMLNELQDGHVNLASAHNVSYYDAWYQDYPRNFREDIVEDTYLGKASTDYRTAAGVKYKIFEDNIGYMRYESFSSGIGNGNLDEILSYLAVCNGLIIDVRSNGGGNVTNSTRIAARFTNEKVLTGYIRHKTGKGHNDFSEPYPIELEPSNSIRWQKKVVVLTNRRSYSATNDFVNQMSCLPNVTIIGDKTGGGSGMPFTSELPNGWTVRFSASPHFSVDMEQIEWGIDPDIKIDMDETDEAKHIDTIIEKARAFSMIVSICFASSVSSISILMSGSIPHSICSMSTLKCGLAEKRTVHPLGSSEVKGIPEPPPVLSPMMVTLGRQLIWLTKSLVALYERRLVRTTTFFCQRMLLLGSNSMG